MTEFICNIQDRNYTTYQPQHITNPYIHKIFDRDKILINSCDNIQIIDSPYRNTHIHGVLILEKNKTFGKYSNKFYYKCIPECKKLPIFLVPYEIKNSFSTKYINKYVLFKFDNWDDKYPKGLLVETFGDITNYNCYRDYYLSYLNLNISIHEFTNHLKPKKNETNNVDNMNINININIKNIYDKNNVVNIIEKYSVIDETNKYVFTIDGMDTTDFDDAISIQVLEKDVHYILCIHISNVPIILNELNLWHLIQRVSTIYLPNEKYHMLPKILSENICSLKKDNNRFVFTFKIEIKNNEIINTDFYNSYIKIRKNFIYDSVELLNSNEYQQILYYVNKLNSDKPLIMNKLYTINNSHDLIAYLMILMNYYSAICIIPCGIYRNCEIKNKNDKQNIANNDNKQNDSHQNTTINHELTNFLMYYENINSEYSTINKSHDVLNLKSYIHITSPIRRIVDIINMYKIQVSLNLFDKNNIVECEKFYEKWTNDIKNINISFKNIKKIQNKCLLLHCCLNNNNDDKEYDCYIIEKNIVQNNLQNNLQNNIYKYLIYVNELKLITSIKSNNDYEMLTKYACKIFIFNEENLIYNKIKVKII